MNVQGLLMAGGVDETKLCRVLDRAVKNNVLVLALAETWAKTEIDDEVNEILNRLGKGWTFYGNHRRNQNRRARKGSGGVGLLVNNELGVVEIKEPRCNGLLQMVVWEYVNVFALYLVPSDSARGTHNDTIWKELDSVLPGLEDQEVIILADGNGHMGELPSVCGTTLNPMDDAAQEDERIYERVSKCRLPNGQGREIVEYMNAVNLVITNGVNGKEMDYTFTGVKSQTVIDFIAVSENIMDKDTYTRVDGESEAYIGSDHKMIWSSVRVGRQPANSGDQALPTSAKTRGFRQNDGGKRTFWEAMRQLGEIEAKNLLLGWLTTPNTPIEKDGTRTDWDFERYCHMATMVLDQFPGRKKQRQVSKQWYHKWDKEVHALKKEAEKVRTEIKHLSTAAEKSEALRRYKSIKKKIQSRVNRLTKESASNLMRKIEELKEGDPKAGWKLLLDNTKRQKKKEGLNVVLDASRDEVSGEKAKAVVASAFETLGMEDLDDTAFDADFAKRIQVSVRRYSREYIHQPELDQAIELEEVEKALKKSKKHKACGVDGIIGEWYKYGGERMTLALWAILSQIWIREISPRVWAKGLIYPIFNDGDKLQRDNSVMCGQQDLRECPEQSFDGVPGNGRQIRGRTGRLQEAKRLHRAVVYTK